MFKKIVLLLLVSFTYFLGSFHQVFAGDALDDVLGVESDAGEYQIINQTTEAKSLLTNSKGILGAKDKPNIFIRIAQFGLKISIILGVLVFTFGGIRFLLSIGDDSKAKKVRDNLIIAGIGIIIAFGAWVILQLILSIGPTVNV